MPDNAPAGRELLLAPGTMIAHFKIMRLAGRGGHGAVYLARDTKLGRKVALKMIVQRALPAQVDIDRVLFEARATAALSHPHIVTVFEVGEHAGVPYVALEYLEGRTLRQRIKSDPPSPKESLRIALAIAQALDAAHARKILHRDLKPENVILAKDGRLRVVDFGLAKVLGGGDETTPPATTETPEQVEDTQDGETPLPALELHSRWVAGTPAYMAPEQWLKGELTAATDVWAFGVLLFELIAGKRPFTANNKEELAARVVSQERAPALTHPVLTAELIELLARSLEKLPDYRPSVKTFVTALERALFPGRAGAAQERSPFRGLLPFGERHADLFFGRDAEIALFLERIREEPVLPVVGASGAGKSSFVQAGVIPQLRDRGRWLVLRMRPGQRPFDTLVNRLSAPETGAVMETSSPGTSVRQPSADDDPEEALEDTLPAPGPRPSFEAAGAPPQVHSDVLVQRLYASPNLLALELRALAERHHARVLLFVDQLEELYTLVEDETVRERFMRAVCSAADDVFEPVRVIFTVRDDFLGKLAGGEETRAALSRATVLSPPDAVHLRDALVMPVQAAEFQWEDPGLPDRMIAEVRGEPAALPLLQFTCRALWERRNVAQRTIPNAAYEAIGGVAGALASHAGGILESLSPAQQRAARQILLRLITAERTRKVLSETRVLEGLDEEASHVLRRFIHARLLTVRGAREPGGGEAELELAHESLIGTWGRLSRWIDESKEELAFLAEVSQAAELWEKRGRPRDEVWKGDALRDARRALRKLTTRVPEQVERFVAAGETREKRSTALRGTATLLAFAVVSIAALLFYREKESAEAERRHADVQRAEAQREGAEGALLRGDVWEARAKLRTSLEIEDSTATRALWTRFLEEKLIFKTVIPGISTVAFAPDGSRLLVQADGPALHAFDTWTFEESRVPGFGETSFRVVYSSSGRWLAISDLEGRIQLRDLQAGTSRVLSGHRYAVFGLAFSPDEKYLASASWDHTVRLWSVADAAQVKVFEGHSDRVYGVAFSPDGAHLATSSWDQTIRVWNVGSGEARVLRGHNDKVVDVAFSPEGKLLASACEDGTIGLFDVAGGTLVRVLRGHLTRVSRVIFHPSGRTLLSGSWDGTAHLWNVADGADLGEAARHNTILVGLELSPDGSRIATFAYDGELRISRVDPDAPRDPPRRGPHAGVAISRDGRFVVSTAPDYKIAVWDGRSGRIERELTGHTNTPRPLAFSPEGVLFASSGFDATIRLWNAETGACLRTFFGHTRPVSALAFTPDGARVVSAGLDHTARVWNVASGAEERVLHHANRLTTVAIDHHSETIATGSFDGRISFWELRSGRRLFEHSCGTDRIVHALAFDAQDQSLVAFCGPQGKRFELAGARAARELPGVVSPTEQYACLAFDPGGGALVHSADGVLLSTHLSDGSQRPLPGPHRDSYTCAFSGDRRFFVSLDRDGALRLRDAVTQQPLWREPLADVPTTSVTPPAWMFEGPSPVKVTRLIQGPGGTLIAGYEDGAVVVHHAVEHSRLFAVQLHGPIAYLDFQRGKLQAASEIGNRRTVDLHPLEQGYCELMADVWKAAPAIWESGHAIARPPPSGHVCSRSGAVGRDPSLDELHRVDDDRRDQ